MGVITLDDGRTFKVDDSFGKLPAEQQQAIVGELKQQLTGGVAKQMSGDVPVKSSISTMIGNIPSDAADVAKGFVQSAGRSANMQGVPKLLRVPADTIMHAKDIYEGLKDTYGDGLGEAMVKHPVRVLSDVISVIGLGRAGIRAGLSRGAGVPPTPELTPAAERATAKLGADQAGTTPSQAFAGGSGVAAPIDVGGEGTLGTVERLANTSTQATPMREFLSERQAGSYDRIVDSLKRLTGVDRTARQALDQTIEARAKAATPLYKPLYENNTAKVIWTPEMERLTGVPEVQDAMRSATAGWQRSQIAQGYGAAKPGATVTGGGILKIIGNRVPAFPNVQFWDYTKNALDKMIADHKDQLTGRMDRVGGELTIIKNKLVAEVDNSLGDGSYQRARAAYAGPSSYIDAAKTGSDILSASSENFVPDFNKLSPVNKQAAREAAVSELVGMLGSRPGAKSLGDLTARLKTPEMRAKILAIMPDQASRAAWEAKLNFEIKSSELVAAGMKNSASARRLAQSVHENELVGDVVMSAAKAAVSGGFGISDALKAAIFGFKKTRDALRAGTDKELVNILTGKGATKAVPRPKLRGSLGTSSSLGASSLTDQQQ